MGCSIKSSSEGKGAFVIKVNSEGPASKAGLKLGDTIMEIDGVGIEDGGDLFKCIGYK